MRPLNEAPRFRNGKPGARIRSDFREGVPGMGAASAKGLRPEELEGLLPLSSS